ncbi:MAG: hypothetical protein AAF907_00700 [Planctomycetota bacterium]
MNKPRRGESPAEFVAREVRREHREPRSWPPLLGGVCVAAALALRFGPAPWSERAFDIPYLWWAGIAFAALGLLLCRGVPRWMSGFLLAACLLRLT